MAKQTFTTGQVLTAAQMTSLQQTAMGGGSTTAKVASYVLVAADAGTVVQMNAAGATTITVNTALFAAGDTVEIQNVGAGVCTVTAGTATVNTSSTLALKQFDAGSLYFNTTSAAIFFATDAADSTSPLTTKGDLYGFSTLDARIPIGTNNQVLTADSAQALGLKWATPATAASGLTLITRQTFSNVASTTTLFDNVFTATYEQYLVTLTRYFAGTGADDAHFNFRSAAPATLITQYYGSIPFVNTSTSLWTIGSFRNDTKAQLSTNSGDTGQKSSATINISNVTSSTTYPTFAGQFNNLNNENATFFSGGMASSTAVTGFILSSSSSNISGTVAVYGLAIA